MVRVGSEPITYCFLSSRSNYYANEQIVFSYSVVLGHADSEKRTALKLAFLVSLMKLHLQQNTLMLKLTRRISL